MRALAIGLIAMLWLPACGGEEEDLVDDLEQNISILPPSPSYPPPNDDPITPAPSGTCGDGICSKSAGESGLTCPKDCVIAYDGPLCGDGICSSGESCTSCAEDCGSCCGNGKCEYGESCASCAKDCGSCCGNGKCDFGETTTSCPNDCSTTTSTCGNNRWDQGEACEWVNGDIRAGIFGGPMTWGPSCRDFYVNGQRYCGGTLRCVGCRFVFTDCWMSDGPC